MGTAGAVNNPSTLAWPVGRLGTAQLCRNVYLELQDALGVYLQASDDTERAHVTYTLALVLKAGTEQQLAHGTSGTLGQRRCKSVALS